MDSGFATSTGALRRRCLSETEISRLLALAYPPEGPTVSEEGNAPPDSPRPLRRAAVLLPLLREGGEWHLLFTRRAEEVERHRGEVSFPGGACLKGETPEQTALRETEEEIGLFAEEVAILGRLNDVITGTGYRVTPVVGRIPWPCNLRLAPKEVSRVFTIPLSWLAQRHHWRLMSYTPPSGGKPFSVIVYRPYRGEVLWGASARITHNFLQALGWL